MDEDHVVLYEVSDISKEPRKVMSLPTGSEPGWIEFV